MSHYDYTFKIIVLGARGVGVSTFLKKHTNQYSSQSDLDTTGVDYFVKVITYKENIYRFSIWQLSPEERLKFLFKRYFEGSWGAIFMYDINNSNSLSWLIKYIQELKEELPSLPILLIGNKTELEKSRQVSIEESINFAKTYNLNEVIEVSSKEGESVERIFKVLLNYVLSSK